MGVANGCHSLICRCCWCATTSSSLDIVARQFGVRVLCCTRYACCTNCHVRAALWPQVLFAATPATYTEQCMRPCSTHTRRLMSELYAWCVSSRNAWFVHVPATVKEMALQEARVDGTLGRAAAHVSTCYCVLQSAVACTAWQQLTGSCVKSGSLPQRTACMPSVDAHSGVRRCLAQVRPALASHVGAQMRRLSVRERSDTTQPISMMCAARAAAATLQFDCCRPTPAGGSECPDVPGNVIAL